MILRNKLFLPLLAIAALAFTVPAQAESLVEVGTAADWGSMPVHLTAPLNDPRVFVVERDGAIRIVENGVVRPNPFLTIPDVDTEGERGLLSLAFAPDHATSGLFYVFVSLEGTPSTLNVLEYKVSDDPNIADPTAREVYSEDHISATNHNGGQLAFARDGNLWVTIGDFGNSANSQSLTNPFGKVLRIDPRTPSVLGGFTAPADNPNFGTPGARPEIWAYGLRNPFRASVAPGDRLVVGDVGEGSWEEINVISKGGNYGWPNCEGNCSPANPNFVDPYYAFPHTGGGQSVIAGHVVRDSTLSGLYGRLIFGDLLQNIPISTLSLDGAVDPRPVPGVSGSFLVSFGEDARGCVYVLHGGAVKRVSTNVGDPAACPLNGFVPPAGTPLVVDPPAGPTGPALTLGNRKLRARRNRIFVKVDCRAGADCRGVLTIRTAARVRANKRSKPRVVVIGARNLPTIAPGSSRVVEVVVRRNVREFLRKRRSLRVRVTLGQRADATRTLARLRTR